MERITFAFKFVRLAFEGITDKGGKPYYEHCDAVFRNTLSIQPMQDVDTMTEICLGALLHDVVEDTAVTIEMIELLFGTEIARLVDLVTRKDGESYMQFIDRIKTCPKATIIKKADIMHNMDLERLEVVTDADLARVKKYEKALKRLESRA